MRLRRPIAALVVQLAICSLAVAADKFFVVASQSLSESRAGEVITVPWTAVARLLPGAQPDKLAVLDAAGNSVPYQFTNFHPDDRNGRYDEVLFQHDFEASEKSATFSIARTARPAPPFPARTFARYVPERYDDFAWENDRIAHRIYGPALDSPAPGPSRLVSSGIDVWAKQVRYPIVDRWYLRGHNNYHKNNGEGFDFYSVGTGRGCGGTGIWDGQKLMVSHNWSSWRVFANGPLRTVFDITYSPWEAKHGVVVSETKRFTVDAGRNLDQVDSTFIFTGAKELTVAIGLGKHRAAASTFTADSKGAWMGIWEEYPAPNGSALGTGVVLSPGEGSGFAEDNLNHLALIKVKSGCPLRYYVGAGWTRSGDFADQSDWLRYLAAFSVRVASPLMITVEAAP